MSINLNKSTSIHASSEQYNYSRGSQRVTIFVVPSRKDAYIAILARHLRQNGDGIMQGTSDLQIQRCIFGNIGENGGQVERSINVDIQVQAGVDSEREFDSTDNLNKLFLDLKLGLIGVH